MEIRKLMFALLVSLMVAIFLRFPPPELNIGFWYPPAGVLVFCIFFWAIFYRASKKIAPMVLQIGVYQGMIYALLWIFFGS